MNQYEECETLHLTQYNKSTNKANSLVDLELQEFDNSQTLNLTNLSKETDNEERIQSLRKTV